MTSEKESEVFRFHSIDENIQFSKESIMHREIEMYFELKIYNIILTVIYTIAILLYVLSNARYAEKTSLTTSFELGPSYLTTKK